MFFQLTKEFPIEKEEEKLSLFADDMVFYIENLNEATKLLELINEYRKSCRIQNVYM